MRYKLVRESGARVKTERASPERLQRLSRLFPSSPDALRRRARVLQKTSYVFDHRLQGELLHRFPLPAIRDGTIRTSVRSRSTRSLRARHRSDGHGNATLDLLESLRDTLIAVAIGKAVYRHFNNLDSASPAVFSAYRSPC